jgi:hypothetical protein
MPMDMYANGDRVAVTSWDFDPLIGDELTIWQYTPPKGATPKSRAWRSSKLH